MYLYTHEKKNIYIYKCMYSIQRLGSFEDEKKKKPSVNIPIDTLNVYFKLAEKLGLSGGYDMIDLRYIYVHICVLVLV
jgi:hypothetical protein